MTTLKTDICVIGAGSAGLSLASGAVQMGARVVMIEGHQMGGDCLNTGCVPSKALLAAAKAVHRRGTTPTTGDWTAAVAQVRAARDDIAPHDSQERFEGLGVQVIRDWAQFTGPSEVTAGETRITARRFVIATGSSPLVPPIPGLAGVPYLTNETLFDQPARPDHLLVLGGGPIGLEMALAHRRLGAEVTVVEAGRALGRDDPEAAAVVLGALRAEGIIIHEGLAVTSVSGGPGAITLDTSAGPISGTHLLVAAGRRANLDRLNLQAAGVAHDRRGVTVGPDLRSTTNRRVYALGDAVGGLMFTHVAGYQAGVAIRSIVLCLPSRARTDHIPWVTYTDPELAQVGLTEAAARERFGDKVQVLSMDFLKNDRAVAEAEVDGLAKVMVVKGRPVGATIVGPHAGDLIGPWALALSARLTMAQMAGAVLPYPTRGEINKRLAGSYFAPRLFGSPLVKRVVRAVQRWLP